MGRMSRDELAIAELDILLFRLNRKVDRLMSEVDDLNTSITELQTASATIIAKLDELKSTQGVDPAAVANAAQAITNVANDLTAAAQ